VAKKQKSLSEEFKELEDIAEKFDEGIDLEEGVEEFERGLKLAKHLKKRLAVIEKQIKEVKEKYLPEDSERTGSGEEKGEEVPF
jgi:exodeoxyribonuclease VII small subunit